MYERVHIFRYVTKGTFDAYNWSLIENKQKFISQIMSNTGGIERSCADIDEAVLNYAEMKAIASDNPLIKEKIDIDMEISRFNLLKRNYVNTQNRMEKDLKYNLPRELEDCCDRIKKIEADITMRDENLSDSVMELDKDKDDTFQIVLNGHTYTKKSEAGKELLSMVNLLESNIKMPIGQYAGFPLLIEKRGPEMLSLEMADRKIMWVEGQYEYSFEMTNSDIGNMIKLRNIVMKEPEKLLQTFKDRRAEIEESIFSIKAELNKPFSKEKELDHLLQRQHELEALLNDSEEKIDSFNGISKKNINRQVHL